MDAHSPAPWRWVEEAATAEGYEAAIRLVDANGEAVVWGYQVCAYDDDLPTAINAEPADRALISVAPQLLQALLGMMPDDYAKRFKADCTGGVAKGPCATCRAWALLASIDFLPVPPLADPEDVG